MDINLTLFAQAATFAAFIWFTASFVWPHVTRAIDARQKQISQGLAAAERGKIQLEQAAVRTADVMRDARERAQEVLAQSEQRGSSIIEEAKIAADKEGARLIAAAQAQIEQEVASARETLRVHVAELAVAGAEQILEREIDAKAHAALLAAVQDRL